MEEKRKYNVLMVDDEQRCHETVQLILSGTNYILVHSEYGGTSAMNHIEKNYRNIDIILLDIMMPDMNGKELVKDIRRDSRFNNLLIILQSGVYEKHDLTNIAYPDETIEVVVKPYNKHELIAALDRAVGRI